MRDPTCKALSFAGKRRRWSLPYRPCKCPFLVLPPQDADATASLLPTLVLVCWLKGGSPDFFHCERWEEHWSFEYTLVPTPLLLTPHWQLCNSINFSRISWLMLIYMRRESILLLQKLVTELHYLISDSHSWVDMVLPNFQYTLINQLNILCEFAQSFQEKK